MKTWKNMEKHGKTWKNYMYILYRISPDFHWLGPEFCPPRHSVCKYQIAEPHTFQADVAKQIYCLMDG